MAKRLTPALVILAVALTACATSAPVAVPRSREVAVPQSREATVASVEVEGSLDISPLRVAEADFPASESPEALAAQRPIVAAGVIDGWQQGPALASYPGGPLDYRILLRVRVTDPLKGVTGRASIVNDLLYIALDQGAVIRDDALPVDQWKPEQGVEEFAAAMPPGTRILVFPREMPRGALGKILTPGDPVLAGAILMSVSPQGIVLEDPRLRSQATGDQTALIGGLEPLNVGGSAWTGQKNMDDLIAHLRQHGFNE